MPIALMERFSLLDLSRQLVYFRSWLVAWNLILILNLNLNLFL